MNDEFYKDEPVYKVRPSNVKAKLKPMFKRENGYFSPYLLIMLQDWDKFDHETFWVNAFDLERVLNTFSDEDLDTSMQKNSA